MKIFPAVDILKGRCVQLVQGKEETAAQFGAPLECAHRWLREGAEALHVINLDGAFGNAGRNAAVIRELIRNTEIFVQLGEAYGQSKTLHHGSMPEWTGSSSDPCRQAPRRSVCFQNGSGVNT